MAFASVVDVDALLHDVAGDSAQGEDIRNDRSPTSDYYTIKDARNNARAAERSAMFDESDIDLLAPWRDVAATAEKILREKSKDLEVASWYTEALIRLHGFAGLRDGILLINGLIEKFWEGLYPEPDEDGMETKVAPLTGLNGDGADGTLLLPIRSAEITPHGDYGGFSFFQYQQARDADKIADPDGKSARIETLGYDIGEFEQCSNSAAPQWADDLVGTLEEALSTYKKINEALRERCGHDAPPFSNITSLLDEVLRTTRFIYSLQLESLSSDPEVAETSGGDDVQEPGMQQVAAMMQQVSVPSGAITSREEALVLLEKAARYFRTYEPHTPLAPGLERLISWGRMTVAELMTELLPDDQARAIYSQLTGVLLDGSDSQRYVAAPKVNASSPSQAAELSAAPISEDSDGGWSDQPETPSTSSAEPSW
ncbi:type VI secretion system protein TssA [Microbulbifer agarilyticus]|uniref:type VI secretion system protein TssA n=1 Tax=Microbulbifer agarilyticus TaxID=260552 RepID=UPI001C95FA9F|nr:type VI secretion system protein TssA [Microbulbifer agarilyticus]MBY6189992.1 type VI secretion system protein TssA [Microbulbifer agarilyticus]